MKIKIVSLFVCFLAFASVGFAQSKIQNGYIGSWSNNEKSQSDSVSGTLQLGKTESVILYFGEESGDYAGYCFINNSEAGKKILAACKDGEKCEIEGKLDYESACKVPGLEADLSSSGKIISVTSVKSLAVKTETTKNSKTANTPEQLVKDLYAAQKKDATNPFIQTKNRALVDKYFIKEFGDIIMKTAASETGYNVDPLYNAQDTDITNFVVEKADENNTVKVKFKNFGKTEEITFFLTKENTASKVWKIDSIVYSDAEDLGSTLEYGLMSEEDIKATEAANKLDGDYMVGSVKCSITETRNGSWARVQCDDQENFQIVDTETMTFGTFNPNEKGRKGKFISPEYGVIEKFVDASGKEFKVSRVK